MHSSTYRSWLMFYLPQKQLIPEVKTCHKSLPTLTAETHQELNHLSSSKNCHLRFWPVSYISSLCNYSEIQYITWLLDPWKTWESTPWIHMCIPWGYRASFSSAHSFWPMTEQHLSWAGSALCFETVMIYIDHCTNTSLKSQGRTQDLNISFFLWTEDIITHKKHTWKLSNHITLWTSYSSFPLFLCDLSHFGV